VIGGGWQGIVALNQDDKQDLPLCYAFADQASPHAAQHAAANRVLDALYGALPKNEDGEFVDPEHDKLYDKVAAAFPDRMELHRESREWWEGIGGPNARQYTAAAFFFRCHGCGYTIPATDIHQTFPREERP